MLTADTMKVGQAVRYWTLADGWNFGTVAELHPEAGGMPAFADVQFPHWWTRDKAGWSHKGDGRRLRIWVGQLEAVAVEVW